MNDSNAINTSNGLNHVLATYHPHSRNAYTPGAIQLRQIESDQIAAGLGMNQLSSDQLTQVRAIANGRGGPEVLRAYSLIQLNTGQGYQEYIPVIDLTKKSTILAPKVDKWKLMKTVEKQSLLISPNPSTNIAIITTQLKDITDPAKLVITDVLGNIIMMKTLVQQYDKTMLPVGELADGIYQCTIQQNGKNIMNSKLVVTHP